MLRPLEPVGQGARVALGISFFVAVRRRLGVRDARRLRLEDLPRRPAHHAARRLGAADPVRLRLRHRHDDLARRRRLRASPPRSPCRSASLMGAYKPVEAFFEPFVSFARYLPASAFIPLLILWAGIGETQKLLVIFIGSVFQIVLMVAVVGRQDPARPGRGRLHAGRSDAGHRAPRAASRRTRREIAEILRLVLGWAWTYVIVAELIGSSSGIGHMIIDSQALLATGQMIFGIIVIGLIGLVSDFAVQGR